MINYFFINNITPDTNLMLSYVLISIFLLTIISLYLNFQAGIQNTFDKILVCFLSYALFHVIYTSIAVNIFSDYTFVDRAAPFGFGYGPLLYFAFMASGGEEKPFASRKRMLLHAIPFLIFVTFYIILLVSPSLRESYLKTYFRGIAFLQPLSMITYAFWCLLYKGVHPEGTFREAKRLIGLVSILLVAIAVFYFILAYNRVVQRHLVRSSLPLLIIYATLLAAVLFAFRYTVKKNFMITPAQPMLSDDEADTLVNAPKYQKSALTQELMDEYELRMEIFLERKLYLNAELTLETLAKELKIPKQHLTQLFSQRLNQNFNRYVNRLRIEYACKLLKDPQQKLKIEEMAFATGFSSKVTFNRCFKAQMGCTPSHYTLNN